MWRKSLSEKQERRIDYFKSYLSDLSGVNTHYYDDEIMLITMVNKLDAIDKILSSIGSPVHAPEKIKEIALIMDYDKSELTKGEIPNEL